MRHVEQFPQIHPSVFVAGSADIVGDVRVGEESSIWFQTVLRGDVMPITIGNRVNIQDGTIIHGSLNKAQTDIGNDVTVGHRAVIHGCKIMSNCLIGMGAIVMDNAVIPSYSLVAAGALVTENSVFDEGHLILGSPAKAVRKLKDIEIEWIKTNIEHYVTYGQSYLSKDVKYYEN